MEALSSESKALYDLLRADITTNVDSRVHASQDYVLKVVQKMLDDTVAWIGGSLTSKIEAVREDLGIDIITQMHLTEDKGFRGEPLRSPGISFPRAEGSSSSMADLQQPEHRVDTELHTRPSNLYVPLPVRGVRDRLNSLPITPVTPFQSEPEQALSAPRG